MERVLASGESVYGLTTRLGSGRDERIDPADLLAFQRQVVANHDGGVGGLLPDDAVRAIIAARLAVLLNGGAGVREELVNAVAALLDDPPAVHRFGSVGAADLTHLAALLAAIGDQGFVLAPHEAAAFLSANAATLGLAALAVGELRETIAAGDAIVALSLQALGAHGPAGSLVPYSAAVQAATGRSGATASAERIRNALAGSFLEDTDRSVSVQDPLSLRTAPQVHGAVADIADRIDDELGIELAARPENPVVDGDRMLSGGNFSAVGLAILIESSRLGLAHLAAASERRTALLSAELRSFRAAGRTRLAGLSWYAAADALAEIRQIAAPVSLGATVLSGRRRRGVVRAGRPAPARAQPGPDAHRARRRGTARGRAAGAGRERAPAGAGIRVALQRPGSPPRTARGRRGGCGIRSPDASPALRRRARTVVRQRDRAGASPQCWGTSFSNAR